MSEQHPLVAFIVARLDEDEQTARAAAEEGDGNAWTVDVYPDDDHNWTYIHSESQRCVAKAVEPDYYGGKEIAAHIAAHDPARVLREVEAKRAIVAANLPSHKYNGDDTWYSCDLLDDDGDVLAAEDVREFGLECTCGGAHPNRTLRAIASVYADHPDYEAGWAL